MRILAMFSAAFAAAAALCAYALPAAWCWLPGLCLAALAAALLLLHGDPVRRVRTIALGLAAGFLWCWADAGRLVSVRALCGEGQTIEAEVCSLPERTQYGYRCVTLLQGNRMQLYLRDAPEDAALGDRVRVTADVTETGNSLYLASNDILLLGFARGEAEWEHPARVPLRYAPQRALLAVQRTITNCFPADTAPLAIALVTGDTSGLPYALQTAMSDAGISHIVAVSGMHVTLLLGVVRLLCLRRRRLTAGVGITVMVFFAAMLGFRPSVTRAVVMNAVLLLAPLLGGRTTGRPPCASPCFCCFCRIRAPLQMSACSCRLPPWRDCSCFPATCPTGCRAGCMSRPCGSAIRFRRGCCARSVRRLRPRSVHWPSRCRWPRGISGRSHWLLR